MLLKTKNRESFIFILFQLLNKTLFNNSLNNCKRAVSTRSFHWTGTMKNALLYCFN